MRILAIESSGSVASAALLEDEKIITELMGPFKVTHSETLMPLISEAFDVSGWDPSDIDLIAVSGGPGSFTGLRIGSATAKGLGFALGKDLVHVPTLDAMAYNFRGNDNLIIPLMDARRNQVYTGIYRFEGDTLITCLEGCAMDASELISLVNDRYSSEKIIFLGDGIEAVQGIIEEQCSAEYTFAEGKDRLQRAASTGLLGRLLADRGLIVGADKEAPEYLRPSQAERVRAEKLAEQ